MTIDTLRQVPLFESLDNEAAAKLCDLLETLDCKADTFLFHAGEPGNAMYLIERGKVRICVQAIDGHEVTLTEMGRGDFFGELALLFFNLWVLINTFTNRRFDAFPYLLLSTVINMLTLIQAPIILMSQNRQSHKDRLRAEIDYQINLRNELALAEIIERLKALERDYLRLATENDRK